MSPPPQRSVAARRQGARRALLLAGVAGLGGWVWRPASATTATMQAALLDFTGGVAPQRQPGRVLIEIAELVDNGNAVPLTVSVDSPMTAADHVRRLAVFNERNPQPDVAVFHLGPASGRARVATRIRLATSQQIVAVAETSEGRYWHAAVDVIVTLAACIEG